MENSLLDLHNPQFPSGAKVLRLPGGVHTIARPLHLPGGTSLLLEPDAVLCADESFEGEALVIVGAGESTSHAPRAQIRGGTLDANRLPITGILVDHASRFEIAEVEVRNACGQGIHVGRRGHYETNIRDVRVYLDQSTPHGPGSIGVHYDKCTDSYVNSLVVIGYETGVRSDSSSNDFHQVHVWNFPGNGPLRNCFVCNGWNDSWNQCYADSPMGAPGGVGFRVSRPFNRIASSRVYLNDWALDNDVIGVLLEESGTHGSYFGNHFTAREGHRMKAAFEGNFDGAHFWGNSYAPTVSAGRTGEDG
jgi:hypothetical protein